MSDDPATGSLKSMLDINKQILTKITALEYVMISVCHTHPDREALGRQIGDLFEFLQDPSVRNGDQISELVENLTGFNRPEVDNAS
jgi:hypothetical protein